MAAGVPQEKAVELLKTYGDMLKLGIALNDMDYMRGLRELEKTDTSNSQSALGLLHAVAGRLPKANLAFEEGLRLNPKDHSLAINYCFMLQSTDQYFLFKRYAYEFADRFQSKKFSKMAYSLAYRSGDMNALTKYMDMHIKLLSIEEGRLMAEKHKVELEQELKDAYETTNVTPEQFDLLAKIIISVSNEFKATIGRVEVSKKSNRSYVIDVTDKSPEEIAEMNYALAEKICLEDKLDECDLIARFSFKRELHTGVSYVG